MVAQGRALPRGLRALIGLAGAGNLAFAAAFVAGAGWAVGLWPWETGRLTHLFLAAMLAAVGAAALWIGWSGEGGSLPAGFLNLAVTLGGIAGYLLLAVPEERALGIAVAVLAVVNVGLLVASRRAPVGDRRPLPALVRGSYVVFTGVLLAVGVALATGATGVMPWPTDPHTTVVLGWIFLGDACYFAYAVARPAWGSARAQLWSFLAYDVVLLPPLLAHLTAVDADRLVNLVVYVAVLAYSAGLAVVHLLLRRPSRQRGGTAAVGARRR